VSLAWVGIVGIGSLLAVMFLLGMPVGVAMGIVGFCGFCYVVSLKAGLSMVSSVLWSTFSNYGLTVIPLFIFMGQIAFYSGVNEKLYHAAYRWVGQIRGGIAMATVSPLWSPSSRTRYARRFSMSWSHSAKVQLLPSQMTAVLPGNFSRLWTQ